MTHSRSHIETPTLDFCSSFSALITNAPLYKAFNPWAEGSNPGPTTWCRDQDSLKNKKLTWDIWCV